MYMYTSIRIDSIFIYSRRMTSQRGKTRCVYCEKEKVTYECNGCKQYFCLEHLNEHNREHTKQLDAVVNQRNLVQETLLEQQTNIEKHNLFEQVNEWEKKSINIIIQTANKIRQTLTDRLKESLSSTEIKLAQLTDELNQIRIQNEFNEIHINKFNEILNQLSKQIEQPQDIAIKQNSSYSFINKISVINPNCRFFLINFDEISKHCLFSMVKYSKHSIEW